ncbi:hypothetical protein RHIZ404_201031 [Rhizobium sp. EC-SD404]|nr:hypothetical protein RHIZ404_201031 [Rhizobium sp. EC-SD404]
MLGASMANANRREIDDLLRQRWHLSAHAVLIHANYVRYLLAKANFDPNQPRVPRGSRRGGRWVRVDGEQSANRSPAQSTADRDFPALAANFDPSEPPDDWPGIPDPRPRSSRERTRIAIRVAEWIARNAWRATPWGRAITIGH